MLELWQKEEEVRIEGVRKRNETGFMYDGDDDNDGVDKVDDDTVDTTSEVKVENNNSSPKHLSPNDSDTTEFPTNLNSIHSQSNHNPTPRFLRKLPHSIFNSSWKI